MLQQLAERYDRPVIVSTHPRTRKRLEAQRNHAPDDPRVHFLKPLGFLDYVKLQQEAACVISDSGTLTEEAALCRFPAVMIRQAHERPEGMDESAVIMAGLSPERVLQAVDLAMAHGAEGFAQKQVIDDYEVDNVSQKVVRLVLSYTDFVNRTVWHKPGATSYGPQSAVS